MKRKENKGNRCQTEIMQELSKVQEKMHKNPFTPTIEIIRDIMVAPCNASKLTNSSIINGYQIEGRKIGDISYHLAYAAAILLTQKTLLYGYRSVAPVVFDNMINYVFECSEDKKKNLTKILDTKRILCRVNYWEDMGEDTKNHSSVSVPNLFALNLTLFWIVFELWVARKIEDEKIIKLFKSILDNFSPKNNDETAFLPDINSFVSEKLTLSPFQVAELKIARNFAEYFSEKDCKNGAKYAEYFRGLNYKLIIRTFRSLFEVSSEDYTALMCSFNEKSVCSNEYLKRFKNCFTIDLNPENNDFKMKKMYIMHYSCMIDTYLLSYWSGYNFRWKAKLEIEKYEKRIFETEERYNKTVSGYEKEKQSKKIYIRSLKDEILRLKGEVEKTSADNVDKLAGKIEELEVALNKEKEKQLALKAEYEQRLRKAEKASLRVSSLEKQVKALEEENEELEEQLRDLDVVEEIEADETEDCLEDELFTSENLEIAKKCKFAFFVPGSADVTELSKLFPNSKFLRSKRTTLDIGSATEYVIACTKGLKHSTYWKIEDQCVHYNIGYICINSYSPKTMFRTAIEVYRKMQSS